MTDSTNAFTLDKRAALQECSYGRTRLATTEHNREVKRHAYPYTGICRANGVLDLQQQVLSATNYQYTVIFSSTHSILLVAKNRHLRNWRVFVAVGRL